RLAETTGHITLVAGGIGVTPIVAMARQLHASDADFRVFYLVRSKEHAAMDQHFRRMDLGERYCLHCDDTDGLFDLPALMQTVPAGGDIYACAPEPMLNAVVKARSGLPPAPIPTHRF